MAKELNNIFIIVPLSIEENHFFLANGLIKEDEVHKLKNLVDFKEFLVIVTKENELNWFNHFWNNKIEENKVNSYHQLTYKGENYNHNEVIFKQILSLEENILKLINFNFTILLKDISQINSFVTDISNEVEIVWKNFDKYDKEFHEPITEWFMTNVSFLNNLFYEKYKRVCYLILSDEQKDSDYYIINQSFRSQQNLLIIELVNDDYSKVLKYRIRVIRQIQNHSYYFFAENSNEVLKDFCVYIFDNYGNWKKSHDELFMIKTEDLKYLSKITDFTDERFRYVWIDEDYYNDAHKTAFDLMENSLWVQKNIFGVILRKHDYYHKHSDFGTDNSILFAFGDSNYPALRTITPLVVHRNPRGFSKEVDYYMLDTNIYKHFYQNNKLVLVNFDNVPYIGRRDYEGCIIDSIEKLCASKVIRLPKFLLEDSFVLTTDYYENN